MSTVFSVRMPRKLLKEFESQLRKDGFMSRNDAIVFLVRLYVDLRKGEQGIVSRFLKILLSRK